MSIFNFCRSIFINSIICFGRLVILSSRSVLAFQQQILSLSLSLKNILLLLFLLRWTTVGYREQISVDMTSNVSSNFFLYLPMKLDEQCSFWKEAAQANESLPKSISIIWRYNSRVKIWFMSLCMGLWIYAHNKSNLRMSPLLHCSRTFGVQRTDNKIRL